MEIDCREIIDHLTKEIIEKMSFLQKKKQRKPSLAIIWVGKNKTQESFIKIKREKANLLGIEFNLFHFKKSIPEGKLIDLIINLNKSQNFDGMVIQLPLPKSYNPEKILSLINPEKDIEGHTKNSFFVPPIGQAVLTVIKKALGLSLDLNIDRNFNKEKDLLISKLKEKKILVVGTGLTGGKPISKTLKLFGVTHWSINSKTKNPVDYFRKSDIVITAVGKKIIKPEFLKKGVILINVGLKKTKGIYSGDYNPQEIRQIASYFTPIIGGIGPLDVLFLFKNLLKAYAKSS